MEENKSVAIKQLNDNTSVAIPTLEELVANDEMNLEQNKLMVLLNQPPKEAWLKKHPMHNTPYLPIERVEWLLSAVFTNWHVEVRSTQVIVNSAVVCVRLYVTSPLDAKEMWQDGLGACPIQMNKDALPNDMSQLKTNGVQLAVPAAESYAIKDAAEKFGKLFGKDVSRKNNLSYDAFLKGDAVTLDDLKELYELKKEEWKEDAYKNSPTQKEIENIERVINTEEKKSYTKIHNILKEA